MTYDRDRIAPRGRVQAQAAALADEWLAPDPGHPTTTNPSSLEAGRTPDRRRADRPYRVGASRRLVPKSGAALTVRLRHPARCRQLRELGGLA